MPFFHPTINMAEDTKPAVPETLPGDLAKELATKTKQVDALQVELTDAADKLAIANVALAQAQEIVADQTTTIAELEATIARMQETPSAVPTLKIGNTEYEVHASKFKYDGRDYTIKELRADKALQAALVKKGVGFLIKKEV